MACHFSCELGSAQTERTQSVFQQYTQAHFEPSPRNLVRFAALPLLSPICCHAGFIWIINTNLCFAPSLCCVCPAARAAMRSLVVLACVAACASAFNIMQFGAVPGDSSDSAASANSVALLKTFLAANASASDRVVLIPATQNFTIFTVALANLTDITVQLEGTLMVSNNISNPAWPRTGEYAALDISQSRGIEITGGGVFDGQVRRYTVCACARD